MGAPHLPDLAGEVVFPSTIRTIFRCVGFLPWCVGILPVRAGNIPQRVREHSAAPGELSRARREHSTARRESSDAVQQCSMHTPGPFQRAENHPNARWKQSTTRRKRPAPRNSPFTGALRHDRRGPGFSSRALSVIREAAIHPRRPSTVPVPFFYFRLSTFYFPFASQFGRRSNQYAIVAGIRY